jgi:hypothetical protein
MALKACIAFRGVAPAGRSERAPPQAAFHIDDPKGKLCGRQGLHALRFWSTPGSMLVAVGNILFVGVMWI